MAAINREQSGSGAVLIRLNWIDCDNTILALGRNAKNVGRCAMRVNPWQPPEDFNNLD